MGKLYSTKQKTTMWLGHGRCSYFLCKWGFQDNLVCDCAYGEQTINRIVVDFQSRNFNRGFKRLHAVLPEAITWITNLEIYLWPISQERFTFNICDLWLTIIRFKVITLYHYIYIMLCIILVEIVELHLLPNKKWSNWTWVEKRW
jgi:hypothetical protein